MATQFGTQFDQFKLITRFFDGYREHDIITPNSQVRVERWNRVGFLGEGAYGRVWLERSETDELRAVKQVPKEKVQQNKLNERELLAMVKLSGYPRYFVSFLGWFEDGEHVYFAMEYIEHGDLLKFFEPLGENNFTELDAKVITKQLLEGLKIMHENKLCHRDIKPENILVASLSPIVVKIADFGVSKHLVDGTQLRTELGSGDYQAPEIIGLISETSIYSYAVDIWSLGCLIYVMVMKEMPFVTIRRLNKYVRTGVFEFPKSHGDASSAALEFVAKLMRPQPDDRLTPEQALEDPWLHL